MVSFVPSTTHTVLTITICMTLIVLQVASGIPSHQLLRAHIQSRAVRGILAVYVGVVAYSITLQCSMDAEAAVVVIDARPGDLIIHGQAWGRWWPADGFGTFGSGARQGDELDDAHRDGTSGLRARLTRLLRGEEDLGAVTTEIRRYGCDDVGVVRQTLRMLDIIEDVVAEPTDRGATARGGNGDTELGHGTRVAVRRFIAEERRRIVNAARRLIPDAHDMMRVETAAFDRDAAHDPPPEPGV